MFFIYDYVYDHIAYMASMHKQYGRIGTAKIHAIHINLLIS